MYIICIYMFVYIMYTGLSQRSNPGTEAVDVKGAETGRSSLTVTCSGLTRMKLRARKPTSMYSMKYGSAGDVMG